MTQRTWIAIALPLGMLTFWPGSASAQTMNPTKAQFIASPDHNSTNPDGTPVVNTYQLEFYLLGATTPFQTVSVGKPSPDGTNTITVDLTNTLVGWPVPGTSYVADVAAVGPGGSSASAMSNTFTFGSTCSYALSSSTWAVAASGGTGSTNVTVGSGCTWAATSGASWLTITAGSTGSGNGTVSFSAAANTSTNSRVGTITIAGQTFSVSQAGTCGFSLSPSTQTVPTAGGTGSTNVTASTGCTWAAVSGASWLTITAGSTGTGNGTVAFSASANTGSSRSGTLTIAGQAFTVTQASACAFSLSASSQSVVAAGGTGTVNVATATGCAWTATSSNTSWLTITAGASGTGNGSVTFSATANKNTATRSATLTIGGQVFTVSQAGTCNYTLSPSSLNMTAAGGSSSTKVMTKAGCAWTAVSSATWLSVTAGSSGSGNGTVSFSAAANESATPRSGTLTIAGQTFTVAESIDTSSSGRPGPPGHVRITAN